MDDINLMEIKLEMFNLDEKNKEDIVFEDDYRIIYKIIGDVPTKSPNFVKRISLLNWKSKSNTDLELDIRRYNTKSDVYGKGISFTKNEMEIFFELVKKAEGI